MLSCDFCWSFLREPARRVGAGPFGARLASAFRTAPSNGRGRCGRRCLSAVVIRAIASPEAEPRDGLPCPASEDSQATPCGSAWPRTPPPIHRFFFPFLFFFVPCRPPPSVRRFLQPALHPRLPGAASDCSFCLSEAEPPPLLCHVVFVSVQHHLGSRVRSPARSRPRTAAAPDLSLLSGRRRGLGGYF